MLPAWVVRILSVLSFMEGCSLYFVSRDWKIGYSKSL